MRKFINSLFLLVLLFDIGAGQTVVPKSTINLWPDPSTSHAPIAEITPSARLRLLESTPTNGFYHVKTEDGKEGWVPGADIVIRPLAPPADGMSNGDKTDPATTRPRAVWLDAEKQQETEEAQRQAEQDKLEEQKARVRRERALRDEVNGAKMDNAVAEHAYTREKMAGSAAQRNPDAREVAREHRSSGSKNPDTPGASRSVTAGIPSPSPVPIQRPGGIPAVTPDKPQIASNQGSGNPATQQNQTPEEKLQQAIDALPLGQEVFHHPDVMELSKPESVQVRISHDLHEDLTRGFPSSGVTEHGQIPVNVVMKVHLTGDPNFAITPISDERQLVIKGKPNEWSFTVVPLKGGKYPLHLLISAVIRTPWGTDEYRDFPVKDEIIFVRVSPLSFTKSFLSNNWQWLWTTILIPLAALFWKRRKGKTHQKQKTAAAA